MFQREREREKERERGSVSCMFQKRNGNRHFKVFLEIGLTLKMGKIVEKYLERHPFSIKLQAISLQIY